MATLVLLLGDQLSPSISSLRGADPADTIVLMAEVAEEAGYVRHHKKKIAFLFAAMRHHAQALTAAGWRCKGRMKFPRNGRSKNPQMVWRAMDWLRCRHSSLSVAGHGAVVPAVER